MFLWSLVPQIRKIIFVHRNDVVEVLIVLHRNTSRTNSIERHAPPLCRCAGTTIRGFTNVISMCTRRVDLQTIGETGLLCVISKYTFGRGRSADVAHADK